MNLQDALDPRGQLTVRKMDAHDTLVETIHVHNNIVLSGRDLIAKLFVKQPIDPVSHVAVGTGDTPVGASDAALAKEVFRKPIAPVDPSRHITTTDANKRKVTITADLDFGEANGALTEAGLFNAAAAGVMYNRVVFPPINKTADFKLTLIWEIIF
ncbi:MAG: hypothetical protein JF614_03095 [Acidobacteria bacterium]|nr:hypothetical protein [Acidobacteriota bacterium]